MDKPLTLKTLDELTFEEMVQLALCRVHSALLEGGGLAMRNQLHFWMSQAITWQAAQTTKERKRRR